MTEQQQVIVELLTVAYLKGVKDGLTAYAWWKDGREYVGTTQVRLSDAKGLAENWALHTMRNIGDEMGAQILAAFPTESD